MKKVITLSLSVLLFVSVFSGCSTKDRQLYQTLENIKTNLEEDLSEYGITDYTLANDIEPDGNDYWYFVEVPSLNSFDEEKKCEIIYKLCDDSDGFYRDDSAENDFVMITVKVLSNGKTYLTFDEDEYYEDDELVTVHQKRYSSSNSDSGSNRWAGSNYDYDGDNQWDDNEWYDALDDYLDENGY